MDMAIAAFTAASQNLPLPPISLSFVTTVATNCSANWPLCPASAGESSVSFTELRAQDAAGFKYRQGPISLLPKDENQILIARYDLATQYLLWVDSTPATPKVINCTKAPIQVPTNKTRWEHAFLGSLWLPGGQFNRTVQCPDLKSSDCQRWQYPHNFSEGCLGKSYAGHQDQSWVLAPTSKDTSDFFPMQFSNDIYRPQGMPAACQPAGGLHAWWHDDHSTVSADVEASLFDVPTHCGEAAGGVAALHKAWKGGTTTGMMIR